MARKKIKVKTWEEAKAKHKLSAKHIQMAKELGMKPSSLGKMGASKQQKWKAPLHLYLEELHESKFGREATKLSGKSMKVYY